MKTEKKPLTAVQPGWVDHDLRHVWHPYTQMLTAPPPIPIERAQGVYLYTPDGRQILDGISSWWVNLHGHSHPRLNRALAEQVERLQQVLFAGFTHQPAARLAAEIVKRAPGSLTRVFYSDDGSTSVEVALKMAYQYWRNIGEPERKLFVSLEHGYHGDTFGSMAAGSVKAFHQQFEDLFFEVKRAYSPYCLHCPVGLSRSSCHIECLDNLKQLLEIEGSRVAAVIIEPMVQAAGGMIIWPVEFLRKLYQLTRSHQILLIADEVFTGFGRTGRFFACQHGPVEPDLICLSKALTGGYLPLAMTLASEKIYQAFLSRKQERTFFHGHSFTANPLACAVAVESLQIFEEEDRLGRVAELEMIFRRRLNRLHDHPAIAETRCLGAVAAIELKPQLAAGYLDPRGARYSTKLLQRGILMRPLGNVLYFLPPLVIEDHEVEWVFDQIEEVLEAEGTG